MRDKRIIISFTLVAALALCMTTSCGNKISILSKETLTDIDEMTNSKYDEITLNVVTMMGATDPNVENYQKVIEDFQVQYPNIIIADNSEVSDTDWKSKIAADFSVDNEPDVIQFFTDATANDVLATNKFVPLEEIRKEYPEVAQNTSAAALEATKSPIDGINYAVPTAGYWEGMFCNKDLFDKYNVELPTNWDSFTKAIKIFKENDIIPVAASLNNIPNYWLEFLMLSASTIDEYVQYPKTAPKSWVKGLSLLEDLKEMGAFPEDTDTIDNEMARSLFKEKKAAMQLEGSWYVAGIPDQINTVVIPFPGVKDMRLEEGTAISGFSSGFYITKKAWENPEKKEAAVNFVLANTNSEQVIEYWGGNGVCSVPVVEEFALTPIQKSGVDYFATVTNPVGPTDSRLTTEAFASLVNSAVGISNGKINAEDAINEMLDIQNRELGE